MFIHILVTELTLKQLPCYSRPLRLASLQSLTLGLGLLQIRVFTLIDFALTLVRQQVKSCHLIVPRLPVLLAHEPLLLHFEFNLGQALEDPIPEFLMIYQYLVLYRTEHADDRDEVLVLQLFRVLLLYYVVELVLGHASRVVVDLANQEHDLL